MIFNTKIKGFMNFLAILGSIQVYYHSPGCAT